MIKVLKILVISLFFKFSVFSQQVSSEIQAEISSDNIAIVKQSSDSQVTYNCQQNCQTLSSNPCSICFDDCTQNSSLSSFTMKTCQITECVKYTKVSATSGGKSSGGSSSRGNSRSYNSGSKIRPYYPVIFINGRSYSSSDYSCTEYVKTMLTQQQCTQKCCYQPQYRTFTLDTFQQCAKANDERIKTHEENLTNLIFSLCLGICLAIIVICFAVCWCCKNCQCCEGENKDNKSGENNEGQQQNPENIGSNDHVYNKNPQEKVITFPQPQSNEDPTINSWKIAAEELKSSIDTLTCSICLQPKINCQTSCNHYFHSQCLKDWIDKKITPSCPYCIRQEINPIKIYCSQCFKRYTEFTLKSGQNHQFQRVFTKDRKQVICTQCNNNFHIDHRSYI